MITAESIDPQIGNVAAPSPEKRIFAAGFAYQMHTAGQPGHDLTATVLLAYLQEIVKGGKPVTAEQLPTGAELAVRCGGVAL